VKRVTHDCTRGVGRLSSANAVRSNVNSMNLTIDYLGLKLRNPFVIGASPMGETFQVAEELQDLAAAAIVMRSRSFGV
jgi:dihydroorotate dehydrogenase